MALAMSHMRMIRMRQHRQIVSNVAPAKQDLEIEIQPTNRRCRRKGVPAYAAEHRPNARCET